MNALTFGFLSLLLVSSTIGLAAPFNATANKQSQEPTEDSWDDWGDADWQDESLSPWQYSGFAEFGLGQFSRDNVTVSQWSLQELRGQLDVKYSAERFVVNVKGEILADGVTDESKFSTRELNVSLNAFENTDVILGRQVITWGTGDYLFLNDLFGKDWQSFFSGRDDTYLKAPNDALRILHYTNSITLDLVYSPEFTPDQYLTGERFSFYSPSEQAIVAPETMTVATENDHQLSVRLATTRNGVEYGAYGYQGFWTTPVGFKLDQRNIGTAYFPKLNAYGASLRMPAFSGLINTEFAVYNSLEDKGGSNPFIANSQIRLLLGYERELFTNVTGTMQLYLEHTQDYDALIANSNSSDMLVDETRQLVTIRLTQLARQQTLINRLFMAYSPTDSDAYLKPSTTFKYSDQWHLSAGANIFVGKHIHTFFGQHKDNSNIWLRIKYNM